MYITFTIDGTQYSRTYNRLRLKEDVEAWAIEHNTHCWIYHRGLRTLIVDLWFEKPRDYSLFALTWEVRGERSREFTIVDERVLQE